MTSVWIELHIKGQDGKLPSPIFIDSFTGNIFQLKEKVIEKADQMFGLDVINVEIYDQGTDVSNLDGAKKPALDEKPAEGTGLANPLIVVAQKRGQSSETLPPEENRAAPLVSRDKWKYETPGNTDNKQQRVRFKEEGPERKRSKPPPASRSPGADLDDVDLKKVNILMIAQEAYKDQLSRIKVPGCPFRKPDLGEFTHTEMGHTRNRLDTRLTKSFDDSTPGGKTLCSHLDMDQNVVLLGKSGCGKTSAIFDAAHKYYCVLFTASGPESKMAEKADPGGFDYSFLQLVEDATACLKDKETGETEKADTCNTLFEALIVSRLLILLRFQELEHASSQLWLVYQLQSCMMNIASDLYDSLSRRPMHTLRKLRSQIIAKLGFFFYAFDEAQELLQDNQQEIWKSSKTEERRGIGSGFVRRLAVENNAVVIAGTALSLGHANSILSDIGKEDGTVTMRDFPTLSLEEIKMKLNKMLNLTGVELGDIPSLWKLEGRGRLFGGLFWQLFNVIKDSDGGEKDCILEKAVQEHYYESLTKLEQRIKDSFPPIKEPIMLEDKRPAGLCKLAIASLWGGTVSFSAAEFDQDLLHVGLCSVKKALPSPGAPAGRKPPLENDYFILDEQLGREAIQRVAQEDHIFVRTFASVLDFCRPAAGHAMEPLFVGELKGWCEKRVDPETEGPYVIDLLCDIVGKDNLPTDLPAWVKQALLRVEGAYDRNSYISQGVTDDIDFVTKALGDPKFRNRLLSPSTVKRPDFEAVMGSGGAGKSWFLSASSKLYSSVYDDTSGADLRSTDPKLFYCKKDGGENNSCRNLRRRWNTEIIGNDDNRVFERCLRIHLCLPDVKHSRKGKDKQYVWVDGESVVLYITADNANRLFRAETVQVLKSFGYLAD